MNTITVRGVTFGEGMTKICIPIVGKDLEEIQEEIQQIKVCPADMVEWRADWFSGSRNPKKMKETLKLLRREFLAIPLLVTYRTKKEGGEGEADVYPAFCMEVIKTGMADFLDLELSAGEKAIQTIVEEAHRQGVKVILSSHDFEKTPKKEEIIQKLCAMQDLGGDMAKIAVMPDSKRDVMTLMDAVLEMQEKWAKTPIIAMAMSGIGTISRMAGEFFGSAVTFGTAKKASAPGQIPAESLKKSMKALHEALVRSPKRENLYFIGFMGSGKSAVSKELARRFQRKHLEMDEEIVSRQKMTIPEIFEKFGETSFREIESRLVKELSQEEGLVVSCGGGVVLNPENVKTMKKHGKIILLTAEPETILKRVKKDENRPLLKGKKTVEDISRLMEERREKYETAADLVVSTDHKTVRDIAEEIFQKTI